MTRSAAMQPFLAEVDRLLRTHHRFAGEIVARSLGTFGDVWAERFHAALAAMFPDPDMLTAAVKGYADFAMTSLRLQARFERSREYQAKTYAEAAQEVYHNVEHMQSEYLPGLYLSHYLWPHHYRQLRFFETSFLEPLALQNNADFVEVGIGTGIYSRIGLQSLPGAVATGIDISTSSLGFAQRQIEAFGLADRFTTRCEDVTVATPTGSANNLICVELLEHLEDPLEFLVALRRVLVPGGRAFITAALNAAYTDHIYLYREPGEVERQLVQAGFVPEQWFVGQAYAPPRVGVPVPLAVAFVVR